MSEEESKKIEEEEVAEGLKDTIPTSHGRTQISDKRREHSFSRRAQNGDLDVVERRCPFCSHHKAFSCNGRIKCTRCKRSAI